MEKTAKMTVFSYEPPQKWEDESLQQNKVTELGIIDILSLHSR